MKSALVVVSSLLLLSPLAQSAEMAAGKWNLTVELNAPGIPEEMRTQVQEGCISVEEAKDPEAALRKSWKKDNCSNGEAKRSGNTLSWSADCVMPDTDAETQISGKMVIHNTRHYTSDLTMKGNDHTMKTHIEGKWAASECQE
ncbi:DUF3617 family protein [Alcanivorax sp. DP30]|uniref:DUF3617 domain-containing protein n=1 Tax=Alcanivorax sp. DP30 TaxID=2606217 RepID=UPI00136A0E92|nr:DUF3617 family protein [Alcanivorax sp. DP30]MZR61421.1 DUF3617 family protein [Alcanivorax sp. DP30]